ncbi:MAG: 16S rRNA (uracil(1498)-N(3))-methyltransferase [bacterium]
MTRRRAFVAAPPSGAAITLTDDTDHYVRRVLRLGVGDDLVLFDGAGLEVDAQVLAVGEQGLELRLGERRRIAAPAGPSVTLLVAELKGDKTDWVVQKTTELGIDRIAVVSTQRSVPRPDEAGRRKRHQRRCRVAQEACRQCGRAYLPEVAELQPLETALAGAGPGGRLLLAEVAGARGLGSALESVEAPGAITLLVGPEGGLTAEEQEAAGRHGFHAVSLGSRTLRAETAAIAAVTLVCSALGRLG